MRLPDIRLFESLVARREFGAKHPEQFPDTSPVGILFSELDAGLDEVHGYGIAQAAGRNAARKQTSAKRTTRNRLRRKLFSLTRAAKIASAGTPGYESAFKMPAPCGDQRLLQAARAIVQDATPLQDQLVAHNLPKILDDASASIDGFEASVAAHKAAKEAHVAARIEIADAIARAQTIAAKLDIAVQQQFENTPALLAEWRSVCQVSSVTIPVPNHKKPDTPAQPVPSGTKAA